MQRRVISNQVRLRRKAEKLNQKIGQQRGKQNQNTAYYCQKCRNHDKLIIKKVCFFLLPFVIITLSVFRTT